MMVFLHYFFTNSGITKGSSILNLKLTFFIIAVVFIVGSLAIALWYRMNDDKDD